MTPWFTSRDDWEELRHRDERRYIRLALGWTARAGLLGLSTLFLLTPIASGTKLSRLMLLVGVVFVGCLLAASALFAREWRAAASAFGSADGRVRSRAGCHPANRAGRLVDVADAEAPNHHLR
jgi:hypothetical protein